ncbi:hypothetical protein PS903_01598 [Pseudomonas fluorescens]|nr:hypothetical protein PS903_01598 [Pseudomonas fluorescens]
MDVNDDAFILDKRVAFETIVGIRPEQARSYRKAPDRSRELNGTALDIVSCQP